MLEIGVLCVCTIEKDDIQRWLIIVFTQTFSEVFNSHVVINTFLCIFFTCFILERNANKKIKTQFTSALLSATQQVWNIYKKDLWLVYENRFVLMFYFLKRDFQRNSLLCTVEWRLCCLKHVSLNSTDCIFPSK